jgi:hypothetical protein
MEVEHGRGLKVLYTDNMCRHQVRAQEVRNLDIYSILNYKFPFSPTFFKNIGPSRLIPHLQRTYLVIRAEFSNILCQ